MTTGRILNHLFFWGLSLGIFVVIPVLNHMHWASIFAAHGVR